MDSTKKLIRIHIDGRWTSQEFGTMLLSITELYNLRLLLEVLYRDRKSPRMERLREEILQYRLLPLILSEYPWVSLKAEELIQVSNILQADESLRVRRIKYGSKGNSDLIGFGEIVGHIKDLVLKLIELKAGEKRRKLEEEKLQTEIVAQKIENARTYVSLARECGVNEVEIRKLIGFVSERQEQIDRLIEQGKIVKVDLHETDEFNDESN